MGPSRVVETEIYASYRQFYLVDPEAESQADLVWDGGGLERHLGVSAGVVAVGTVGYCPVPVRIELWSTEPPADLDDWDHVVEASLEVGSGHLALEGVDGPGELAPLDLPAGDYRLRSSASGLDDADEMDGGDRYRVQLWPAASAEPAVLRWWAPWDPRGVIPRPTRSGGRVLLGAESHDARIRMSWLASRGVAHLFEDSEGAFWEHSNLPDAGGTPQLEELDAEEAERRYGPRAGWGPPPFARPGVAQMMKSIVQTMRYSRGWRPEPDPTEPVVEDGERVLKGNTAINRLWAMERLGSEGGDSVYRDGDGTLWEWRHGGGDITAPRLTEITPEEARAKYGVG